MVRKTLDSRIHTLIKNGVQNRHRSFFVLIGDKGKDQVVNLHWLLSQAQVTSRPSVLWCYKKDLGFSSHRKKRESKIKKEIKRGIREANTEDPFELFISVTDIRYTYYKESHKILGNTYGMCILQDFEALTPNLLARTVETVEGGGIVVLLLRTMKSLKQLYTMAMDVHSRYRTEAHDDVVARFNERFILSLSSCETCLVVDDELNVLPISAGRNVRPLPPKNTDSDMSEADIELKELKQSLADTQPVGALVGCARTLDQAKSVLTFVEAISEKTLRSTVTLTAARGRGKSAALGVAIAAAVAHGYANIFVTSPSPENLKTLFEFIFKGFDALKYEEHLDYDIVQSTNPDFNKAVVRVNIFRQHRQTIQYIQPQDAHTLGQAELVVIDEAAAIPLPLVKSLLGPYLVFMASTINGYEGTGRSLSLKLIQQLREQSRGFIGRGPARIESSEGVVVARDGKARRSGEGGVGGVDPSLSSSGATAGGRVLREIKLEEPIRYSAGDHVERWLNKLLCLDCTATSASSTQLAGCPHPSNCELYHVNRDTLFSYHPVSEAFLQRMMALYVASHYKNTPNDLQLLSDAPAHHLFVLLPPVKEGDASLPEPLCVIQVALEGEISKQTVLNSLARGQRNAGDLIPWLVSQQFQDDDFASLSGARIVRIATHPDYVKMGYGARALELLGQFYEGKFASLDESGDTKVLGENDSEFIRVKDTELENSTLQNDDIRIRDPRKMPPLLLRLSERRPQRLHWLGVSYGLTAQLHRFWKRSGFSPVYLRQTTNDLTGEHSAVMLKTLRPENISTQASDGWLTLFSQDFRKRFLALLSYQFKAFPSVLALSILEAAAGKKEVTQSVLTKTDIDRDFTAYDLKRLDSYARNMLDYHVILDLMPSIAEYVFNSRMGSKISLSGVQSAILLAIGLQHKSIDDLEKELSLPASQIMALFAKIIRKVSNYFQEVMEGVAMAELAEVDAAASAQVEDEQNVTEKRDVRNEVAWDPVAQTLDEDLGEAEIEAMNAVREKQRELINSLDLSKYAIGGKDEEWEAAAAKIAAGKGSKVVSIANPDSSKKRKQGPAAEVVAQHAKLQAKGGKGKVSKKARRT